MKTPCDKSMQPQPFGVGQPPASVVCPTCKGEKSILRGKDRVPCKDCGGTGVVTGPVGGGPIGGGGYKTK